MLADSVMVNTVHFLYADRIIVLLWCTADYNHGCHVFLCGSWAYLSYL